MQNDLLCKARKEKERVKDGAGEMSQPLRASVALVENPGIGSCHWLTTVKKSSSRGTDTIF